MVSKPASTAWAWEAWKCASDDADAIPVQPTYASTLGDPDAAFRPPAFVTSVRCTARFWGLCKAIAVSEQNEPPGAATHNSTFEQRSIN